MYKVSSVISGPVATNCYTIINEETNEAVLVDASGGVDLILREVRASGAKVVAVLLTHAHFDHIDAVEKVKKEFPELVIYIGENDEPLLHDPELNLSRSFTGIPVVLDADRILKDGEELEVIGLSFRSIEVPGHTRGGMCYYLESPERVVFCGDTLFHGSVGRSDFPTGDGPLLLKSIEEKLLTLPEDTTVYPGHDSVTSIGWEKKNNFYFL